MGHPPGGIHWTQTDMSSVAHTAPRTDGPHPQMPHITVGHPPGGAAMSSDPFSPDPHPSGDGPRPAFGTGTPTRVGSARLSEPLPGATVMEALTRFFRKGTRFDGYASRSEFWWVWLINEVVMLLLTGPVLIAYIGHASAIDQASQLTGSDQTISLTATSLGVSWFALSMAVVGLVWSLAVVVPMLALAWRRMHDAGFSGLMYLLCLIPWIGGIIVIVLLAMPTKQPPNPQWADRRGD